MAKFQPVEDTRDPMQVAETTSGRHPSLEAWKTEERRPGDEVYEDCQETSQIWRKRTWVCDSL